MIEDEDIPQLPSDTLAILNQFLEEKKQNTIGENWQLSQFWYDDLTTQTLANAVEKLATRGKVALLSCPTLMQPLLDKNIDAKLFEFDTRFSRFEDRFIPYDYRKPTDVPIVYHRAFDVIIGDPPFLSEECLTKAMETIRLLQKDHENPIILCTGTIMCELAATYGLKRCSFTPRHENNLANDFSCYTNFGELP